ncbi:hypothetical protein DPV78_008074 [Talaromyces pinophilus]|nr:hypothetical protein DPV78_008074 [Talaromyces pinophilus]
MSWRQPSNQYLRPGYSHQSRPSGARSSSASFTDTMSNDMHRLPSQSSHVTESSQTASSIHSNIGDSIASFATPNPSYIQHEPETFFWSSPQIQVQDHNAFTAADHPLLPPDTPLPRPTPDVNDPLQNIEASINDPRALLELVIDRLRQIYATHPNQAMYALSLAQTHLGTNAIRRFIAPRVVPPRSPQPPATPSVVSPIHRANSATQQYMCKLCSTPVRITSRGAFKRHVNEKHQPKSMFLCMHCDWTGTRKDKLRDHLKTRHYAEYDREQDLSERELVMAEPSKCDLCETDTWMNHIAPFTSWDVWFAGIVAHCRFEEASEDEPKKEPDSPPNQGEGSAGGSSGFLFSNLTFTPGSSAGSASLFQGSNLTSDSVFTSWTINGLSTQQLDGDGNNNRKQTFLKTSPNKKGVDMSDISKDLCQLSLDEHHPGSKTSSRQDDSIEVAEQWVPREMMLISGIIQELEIATLVFSINKISVRLTGKLQDMKSENHSKVAVDPLILGERTLYRIHYDHSISHQILARHLRQCHSSLNAIQWELSTAPTIPAAAMRTTQQCRRRKRLSSLWARLRAVSFVLSLQKEVAVDEEHVPLSPHPSNMKNQLTSPKHGPPKATMSSFTSEALGYLYSLTQKHLPADFGDDTYDVDKNDALQAHSRSPSVNSPLGVFGFLQSLMDVISNPQPSLMESYDTTDLYGLLHRSIINISTTAF